MITYQIADKKEYPSFKKELEHLYLETFTKGISAQQITKEEAEDYLKSLFNLGYGVLGFSKKQLLAALIVVPISYDQDCPEDVKQNFGTENVLYIAEVLVDASARGQGLGRRLMQTFEDQLGENIQHVLLRVWRDNEPAVALYRKMGFKNCGEITQQKTRPNTNEKFTMHKNYMVKSY
jgi:ribosomal protein S18 acetylase RimI-like enzyme